MADKTPVPTKARTPKKKKERSYKARVILWTVVLMVIDEVTIGIPEADLVLFYVVLARPRWFLEMTHKLYKYVPHRRAWRPVKDVCQPQVATVTEGMTVAEAVRVMRERGVRSVVVVAERTYNPAVQAEAERRKRRWWGKKKRQALPALPDTTEVIQVPVGLLDDRDVTLQLGADGLSGDTLTVAEVMNRDVPVALETEDVHSAVTKMREAGMRRLPVVDRRGALVGLLSLDDIISVLSDGLNDLMELMQREMAREAEVH